jgi:hypothetical protein
VTRLLRLPLTCALATVFVLSCMTASAVAQGEVESVQKFVGRKDQWSALVGARFVLEGRVSVMSGSTLQFDRCDLNFRLKPGTAALPRDARVAEVTGKLAREGKTIYFDVDSLRRRESDLETLRTRRSKIDTTRPDEWFELADWVVSRGDFYDDSEFKKQAEELREIGLTAESRRLKSSDSAGLLQLAKRASDWNLEQGVVWKFTHDAVRIELDKARRDPANDGSSVLALVFKSLPGAKIPLKQEDLRLREAYEKNKAETYAKADTDTRFKLHRALYIELLLALIERDVQPEGKNGYSIAERISTQIPELESLADSYRKKEIAWLKGRLSSLSRDELLNFAKKLADRGQDTDAKQVKTDWLRAKEPAARATAPRGLMQLADDYVQLLADEKTAIELYQQVWISNPQSAEATEWLTSRGLVLDGSRWVPQSSAPKPMEDRFAQAIQEGQVLAGMTGEQARAAMGARPSSIVRQASRGKVLELWIYKTEGLVVTLSRNTGEKDSHVQEVASLVDDTP